MQIVIQPIHDTQLGWAMWSQGLGPRKIQQAQEAIRRSTEPTSSAHSVPSHPKHNTKSPFLAPNPFHYKHSLPKQSTHRNTLSTPTHPAVSPTHPTVSFSHQNTPHSLSAAKQPRYPAAHRGDTDLFLIFQKKNIRRCFVLMATTTATPDATDGPVMSLINKRLRALRKKLNRILAMEESVSQGKPLNKEQEEVLRSKPSVLALIDEFEKLRQPLASALTEELNITRENKPETLAENSGSGEHVHSNVNDVGVEDLLNLLYFGSLFDVKSDFASTMLTRTHERGCCLTYDYVTDDATDLLGEKDLDSISALRGLLISRPADSSFSHKDALERCAEHAKLWLAKSEQPIGANADVTYAGLREKLNKIMSSEYFTTTPEMKAPVEVAAAAGGNYVPFHVSAVHGSVVPVEVEHSVFQSQEKDEGTTNFEGDGSGDDQYDPEGELQKDEVEADHASEVVSVQHEQNYVQHEQSYTQGDVEHSQQDAEAKEHQSYPRRGYQNHRGGGRGGGGRRGYSNGRGSGGRGGGRGGYQNGRNQYYDQPGNYYPRNYYNNNRGRGGRGGGYSYNNHGPGGQVNHVAGDVGVQS
ncbi:hypothetical protein RJT34_06382 [Clitoria ternatea]|uniref:Glycine-rich protein n=1 Tax=Clitoria ternatea TaxID=43366 RepID=A0AAN9PUA2_CLITE